MTDAVTVVLTSRDFALLENLVRNWVEPFQGANEQIRRKLSSATLVFPNDVPSSVVTLNSRVRFRAGASTAEERTVVGSRGEAVCGVTLPLASARGVALIGAAVGQTVEARRPGGSHEMLRIEAVAHQPDQVRPAANLKVVSRQELPETRERFQAARPQSVPSRFGNDDDPGPSAA